MIELNDGKKIPSVLFGTFMISEENTLSRCLETALEAGYRGFDTAAVYRNENAMGRILKTLLPKFGLTRKDIFITSKLAPSGQGYTQAKEALRCTLQNLDTDYLDLYLIHWPGTAKTDKESPILLENRKASWRALEEAQKNGLVLSIGVSNYMVKHLEEMKLYAVVPPAVNQVECHPFLTQRAVVKYCREHNIHFQAYSSLGSTAHHLKLTDHETVTKIAAQQKRTAAQILLKWGIEQGFSVLPKSTNVLHIKSNIDLFDWNLTKDQLVALLEMDRNEHFCWDPNTVV